MRTSIRSWSRSRASCSGETRVNMSVASTNGANFATIDECRAARREAKHGKPNLDCLAGGLGGAKPQFTRDDFLKGTEIRAEDPAPESIAVDKLAIREAKAPETIPPPDPREIERQAMREQADAERAKIRAERAGTSVRSVAEAPKKPLPMPEAKTKLLPRSIPEKAWKGEKSVSRPGHETPVPAAEKLEPAKPIATCTTSDAHLGGKLEPTEDDRFVVYTPPQQAEPSPPDRELPRCRELPP